MHLAKLISLATATGALLLSTGAAAQSLACVYPAGCKAKVASETEAQYLLVKVTDASGKALPHTSVSFRVEQGSGQIVGSDLTDADGFARTVWRPGTNAFPAKIEVSTQVGNSTVEETIELALARTSKLDLRPAREETGNDQWWYEDRQLRDSLIVEIANAANQEECERTAVAFRSVGGGVAAPDTAYGRWRAGAATDCAATAAWRIPKGIGSHYLRASLVGEPAKNVTFKANARALPRVNVGLAWSRRSGFSEVRGVDTIEIRREFPDQNTVVVKDTVISEVRDVPGEWVLTPTIGIDFPLLRQFAGLRFSASTSLTDPDENLYLGISGFQPFFGTGQEALGIDLHVGLHVQRQKTLINPVACRTNEDECDTERRYRYGLSFMGLVDGVSLLGNLITIFGG